MAIGVGGTIANVSVWPDALSVNQIADRYLGATWQDVSGTSTVTISGYYDNGGTNMAIGGSGTNMAILVIGGSVCHLCGEPKTVENVYGRQSKKSGWQSSRAIEYACGTMIRVSEKGKNTVIVGSGCIQTD